MDLVIYSYPEQSCGKEARLWAFPSAAGRFCIKLLFRRVAVPAKHFFVTGCAFLWNKSSGPTLKRKDMMHNEKMYEAAIANYNKALELYPDAWS